MLQSNGEEYQSSRMQKHVHHEGSLSMYDDAYNCDHRGSLRFSTSTESKADP